MATTKEQMAADRDAFANEFDQEHAAPKDASDDEVFGLDGDDGDSAAAKTAETADAEQSTPQTQATGSSAQDADPSLETAQAQRCKNGSNACGSSKLPLTLAPLLCRPQM